VKIAFIGQKGIPATFGGVEYHVEALADRLVRRGHQVDVYVRDWYTPAEMTSHRGIRLLHTATTGGKHLDAFVHSLTSSFDSLFRDHDVVHYHALGPSFFSWIPRTFRRKTVVTIHRLDWQAGKWGRPARGFLRFCERTAVYGPARTIVVSKSLQSYFRERFRKELIYIPNGVDLPAAAPPDLITRKYGLKGNDYILFLGRMEPEKRPNWAIRAFHQVLPAYPDLKLVMAGGGSESFCGQLRESAQGSDRIFFPGFVVGREKEELFSNALLFLLPSYLEGFPIALLEAMSYGRACLASDIGPHCEMIGDGANGRLFCSESFSDLAAKLDLLLSGKEDLSRLGRSGFHMVAQRHNWDRIAQETEEVYRRLFTS